MKLNGHVFFNNQERREYYYAIDNPNKEILRRFSKPEDVTWGWLLKSLNIFETHNLKYGIEGNYFGYGGVNVEHSDDSYFKKAPSSSDASTPITRYGAFIQDSWAIQSSLEINTGLRFDYYRADQSQVDDKYHYQHQKNS